MKSTVSNYAQVKENIGWQLAMDHIGSVLVQRARKWDRDHKQIQITTIALEIVADQLCPLNIASSSGSEDNTEAAVLLKTWGKLLSGEIYNIKIRLQVALGRR